MTTTIAVWDMADKRRYGSGSLRQRTKNGNWEIGYRLPSGKQKWETTNTKDRDIAEVLLAERLLDIKKGKEDVLSDTRFEVVAEQWLADREIEGVQPKTYEMFETIIRCHLIPHFGQDYLYEITVPSIRTYRNGKLSGDKSLAVAGRASHQPLSAQTVTHHMSVLRQIFKFAMVNNLIDKNVADLVSNPSIKRKAIQPLTPDEVKDIIAATSPEHQTLLLLLVSTGLRISEATGLRQSDWDSTNKQIKVRGAIKRKGGKLYRDDYSKTAAGIRTLTVSDDLAEKLDKQLAKAKNRKDPDRLKLLFPNQQGRYLNPSNLRNRVFKPALRAAGLQDVRLHDFRHTWASEMLSANTPAIFVQSAGGWSNAASLNVYSHLTSSDRSREADTSDLYS